MMYLYAYIWTCAFFEWEKKSNESMESCSFWVPIDINFCLRVYLLVVTTVAFIAEEKCHFESKRQPIICLYNLMPDEANFGKYLRAVEKADYQL